MVPQRAAVGKWIRTDNVDSDRYTARMLRETKHALAGLGIESPTLLIDEVRARRNIARMIGKAIRSGVVLRPHFKTHQYAEVGQWFREAGIDRITVSSPGMAEYFQQNGWMDITVALLVNPRQVSRLRQLSRDAITGGGALGVLVASADAVRALHGIGSVHIWLKTDTGYGRSGIRWDDLARLRGVLEAIPDRLVIRGLLTHAGHTYAETDREKIVTIHQDTVARLQAARQAVQSLPGCEKLLLSLGDTPSCSLVENFDGIDEIRPGNFVFYDLMQLRVGSCTESDLAAAVACPVLEIDSERHRLVLHGGAVQLSKESLPAPGHGAVYGYLGTLTEGGGNFGRVLPQAPLTSLSQEHGIVQMDGETFRRVAAHLRIGDLVLVWPVHSCLTCNLHAEFRTLDGRRGVR